MSSPTDSQVRLSLTFALLILAGCGIPGESGESQSYEAAFITRLGADTLAVEQFQRGPTGMTATVVLRAPRTTIRDYELVTDERGAFRRFHASMQKAGGDGETPSRRETVWWEGDSLAIEIAEGADVERSALAAGRDVLPFLDMIHWPFELMLTRAYASEADSVAQVLLAGRRTLTFVVSRISVDSMTVTHPFRGTMGVDVDRFGRLVRLDAAGTTRKLLVERVASVDMDSMAAAFAARDQAGRFFGALSGRGLIEANVSGASIRVDYGTPSKRGRDVFGSLVPYGEVWRTGANRATHFSTDADLNVGGLDVPEGEYTLYTIPEEDGGTLMINSQTGQGGTTYDAALDLGRVRLVRRVLDEPVEVFTIAVDETAKGGILRLQWDRTEYTVSFSVIG
jgi:hypothetical protein